MHPLTIPKNGVLEGVDEEDICEVRLNFWISEISHVRKAKIVQGKGLEVDRGRTCVRRLAVWFSGGPQRQTKRSTDSLGAMSVDDRNRL